MKKAHVVVPNFFDGAAEARAAFEAHFSNPHKHTSQHQVWNYWYVPDAYTYLRTDPAKILPKSLMDRFVARLNSWARTTLGMSSPHQPWMSLYVNGCSQTIHNDSLNGQFGYVYSITKWSKRNFLGGETLLFRDENYWETGRIKAPGAGENFYEKVPSLFNQLLVFDDRVIHAVEPFMGTMDPLAGRVVMHGHLQADELSVSGSLRLDAVQVAIAGALGSIIDLAGLHARTLNGFMTLRLLVQPDGRVASVRTLCDRVLPTSADKSRLEPFRETVLQQLGGVAFPPAAGASEVSLPVRV
jgi:hypothetical protein